MCLMIKLRTNSPKNFLETVLLCSSYCLHFQVAGTNGYLLVGLIERPSSLKPRAMTWSNYKHHDTIKIASRGVNRVISLVSEGCISGRYLTEYCGI